MRLPILEGLIRRRLLLNYRADPSVVERLLPSPLRPKLARGQAVVGICLIRLEQIRPRHLPAALGISSENAAHRIAVAWEDAQGQPHEGVYIPRRDTDSFLNHLAGGRIFPGEHHHADFEVNDDGQEIALSMKARDGGASLDVRAATSSAFSSTLFSSLDDASDFFRRGSLGYSERDGGDCLDGITLHTDTWEVSPLDLRHVRSSFFEDTSKFPPGSLALDLGLLMRDIPHAWHAAPDLPVQRRP
jgi:hypothetical protein